MKKLVLVALLLSAMIHSSMANPKNPNKTGAELSVSINAASGNQKKAYIKVDNLVEGKKSFLKIKDEKGRLLHAETIHKGSSFARTYDFSHVASGEYTVEVRTKEGISAQKFTIQEEEKRVYFKPVIRTESDMIRVVFKNPMEAPLSLKLYNRYGQVIYKTEVDSQEVFATGLDISQLRGKQYRLSLKNNDYSYSKSISTK